jgi:hypothetical protein
MRLILGDSELTFLRIAYPLYYGDVCFHTGHLVPRRIESGLLSAEGRPPRPTPSPDDGILFPLPDALF